MAGVALAWLLDGDRDVVLLEARDSIGGNVQSVDVDLDGQSFVVDMGAQYFHPGPYPLYTALLTALGLYAPGSGPVESHAFPASITLTADAEPSLRFVSPVLPQRAWPLFAQWNQAGTAAFLLAFSAAKRPRGKRRELGGDARGLAPDARPVSRAMGRHAAAVGGVALFRRHQPGARPLGPRSDDLRREGPARQSPGRRRCTTC